MTNQKFTFPSIILVLSRKHNEKNNITDHQDKEIE